MDNPTGRVVSLVDRPDGARAIVAVTAAACPRCAAGKGCGAGLFAAGTGEREVEAQIPSDLQVAVDDIVELALAPDNILQAAKIVYGLPMTGAIAGAALAWGTGLGDAAAAACALLGLAGGVIVGRRRLRDKDCLNAFTPAIEAVR